MSSDSSTLRGEPFLLAQEAEQEMLRADVVVPQRASLVLAEDDHLAGRLREPLEHDVTLAPSRAAARIPGAVYELTQCWRRAVTDAAQDRG